MNGFNVGDRVENSYGARGEVIEIRDGAVHVMFNDRGKTWNGIFDDVWFRTYPDMLKRIDTRR